ncbi:MAG: protein translocase subunit SecF [Actinobacteria bacterium]|nr:protein translocase subunit SecF [Actinomycetota bacterium]
MLAGQLAEVCGVPKDEIKAQIVGPTWGSEISKKALQGLIVFILLVMLFLSIYFEWRMAVAALVALVHDLVITVGIYSLTGLEVTPATVIGLLTILGYSLYDTVVVFDKVKENTRGIAGQSVMTYGEAANLAVNQTLIRSINTSIVALLPVVAIIVVGAGFLGAGTLLDLAVALAVGMAAGAYSSIFIATPFLVQLKERQPEMKSLAARVSARRKQPRSTPAGDTATATESVDATERVVSSSPVTSLTRTDSTTRQQPRKQPRSKRGKG